MDTVNCQKLSANENLPYEKYMKYGADGLTEQELLAIILRTGTKEKSALNLAEEIWNLAKSSRGGLLGLYDLSLDELMQIKGIGLVKAVKLKCIAELSVRMSRAGLKRGVAFRSPKVIADYFMELLRHRDTECVILVSLDAKYRIIREKTISEGIATLSVISPREIFIELLKNRAVFFVLVHNHPSGDPTPSGMDCRITVNLSELGQMMGIPMIDHVIIGDRCFESMNGLGYVKHRKEQ